MSNLESNDSIRPSRRVGTVCVVGHPSKSQIKRFTVRRPGMSNNEAIEILENIETGIYGKIAIAKAIDALRLADKETILNDDGNPAYSHTHKPYSPPSINQPPEAICPKCGKSMDESGFFPAGVIECNLYHWNCIDCGIRREQAHDWPNFQPREWHRPLYSIRGGEWIREDETEKLKAALDDY